MQATKRRTKEDFVGFVCRTPHRGYADIDKARLVLDNPHTDLRSSLQEVLGK